MDDAAPAPFFSDVADPFVVILGANEIASAIAVRLCWEGVHVVLSHDPDPPVIRRRMAFHDALFDDEADVDGVIGRRAETAADVVAVFSRRGRVAVTPLPLTDLIPLRTPGVIVEARMQKYRVTPDLRGVAPLVVGVGPQFSVEVNCDVAVETHPSVTGALVEAGETRPGDGVARLLGGVGMERFVYTPTQGLWRTPFDVGARVFKDVVLGYLDDKPIRAPRDGVLRGIARDGVTAAAGVKLVEVDPRGRAAHWTGTDERGRAIAAAVLEAIRKARLSRRRFASLGVTIH
jgi:xanthine dehydrogenase accessory factor